MQNCMKSCTGSLHCFTEYGQCLVLDNSSARILSSITFTVANLVESGSEGVSDWVDAALFNLFSLSRSLIPFSQLSNNLFNKKTRKETLRKTLKGKNFCNQNENVIRLHDEKY